MTRRCFAFVALAIPLTAQRRKQDKGPEVEVVEVSASVESGRVTLDGSVRNVSGQPLKGLVLFFEMLDADGAVLTRQHGTVEKGTVPHETDIGFELQLAFHARAVQYRLSFEDGGGRELRATNTGPFPLG